MKKFYLIAALSCCFSIAQAESKLNLSTYTGTDIERYAGKKYNVSVVRYFIQGWNTISLPFYVDEERLDQLFGSDCKLERLVGVENSDGGIKLNFQNCKSDGIQPNTPYILYYSGTTGNIKISMNDAEIYAGESSVVFNAEGTGETVKMACAQMKTDAVGLYGVLAKDNSEATFVNTDAITSGFYATRCYVQLSSGNQKQLTTNHIGKDVTSISQVAQSEELVDVYSISGALVVSQISASDINNLQKGIYVIKGKKVIVK